MPPYRKVSIGPAILRDSPLGDEGAAELQIRRDEKVRQEVVEACRDHAEGNMSKEKHDSILRNAHYRLNKDDSIW